MKRRYSDLCGETDDDSYSSGNEKKFRTSTVFSSSTDLANSGDTSPSGNAGFEHSAVLQSAVNRLRIGGNGPSSDNASMSTMSHQQGQAFPYVSNRGACLASMSSSSSDGSYHAINRQLELLHRERCLRIEHTMAVKMQEQGLVPHQPPPPAMIHSSYSSASSMLRQAQFGSHS
jgi:hypothetical protein